MPLIPLFLNNLRLFLLHMASRVPTLLTPGQPLTLPLPYRRTCTSSCLCPSCLPRPWLPPPSLKRQGGGGARMVRPPLPQPSCRVCALRLAELWPTPTVGSPHPLSTCFLNLCLPFLSLSNLSLRVLHV